MKIKKYLINISLSILVVSFSPYISVQARYDLNPELYDEKLKIIDQRPPHASAFAYPQHNNESRINFSNIWSMTFSGKYPGDGIAVKYADGNLIDSLDGSKFYYDFHTNVSGERNFNMIINYYNQLNYQYFSCRSNKCYFQEKRHGSNIYSTEISSAEIKDFNQLREIHFEVEINDYMAKLSYIPLVIIDGNYEDHQLTELINVNLKRENRFSMKGKAINYFHWPENVKAPAGGYSMFLYSLKQFAYQLKTDLIKNVYRQNDDRWGEKNLGDTQLKIKDYGCALTSAAMMLNYWGHEKSFLNEPDPTRIYDQPVTPEYLNSWLKNQADGYDSSGNISWFAISRFSLMNSLQQKERSGLDLPVIEFDVSEDISGNLEKVTTNQIHLGRPVIVKIDGQVGGSHFVLAINDNDPDNHGKIKIVDPYYTNYKFLDEQTEKVGNIKGLRLFGPSSNSPASQDGISRLSRGNSPEIVTHNDLSYIAIESSSPNLEINLNKKDKNNYFEETTTLKMYSDNLGSASNGTKENEKYTYYLKRPSSGEYDLQIKNNDHFGDASIGIWMYDQNGNHQKEVVENLTIVHNDNQNFSLNYDKENSINTVLVLETTSNSGGDMGDNENLTDWAKLLEIADQAKSDSKINTIVHHYLSIYLQAASKKVNMISMENNSKKNKAIYSQKYTNFIKNYIEYYYSQERNYFDESFYLAFNQLLQSNNIDQ